MYMVPLTISVDTYGLDVRHENPSLIGQIDSEIQSQVSDQNMASQLHGNSSPAIQAPQFGIYKSRFPMRYQLSDGT